jgi:hypothetical protein
LNKALKNIPEALLTMVNKNYLEKVSNKIVQQHGPNMKGCVFVLDDSLHQLELVPNINIMILLLIQTITNGKKNNVKKVYTFFALMEQLPGITLIF